MPRRAYQTIQVFDFFRLIPLCFVLIAGVTRAGDLKTTVLFDIKAQSLTTALIELSKQAHVQVMSSGADLKTLEAPAVKGRFTLGEALDRLLVGTGLRYTTTADHTIAVRSDSSPIHSSNAPPVGSTDDANNPKETGKKSSQDFRVAQLDQTSAGPQVVRDDQNSERKKKDELTEIVVTGTHIRGVEVSTAPVIILDKAYIDSTGISNTSQLIATLPQNFALVNQSGVQIPGISSNDEQGASINLRAIGEGTTLVLLNGHRMAPADLGHAVDISAIPLSAIKRVEIMTDGASAIYGSDAIGGVVNFILRDDYEGVETAAQAGVAPGGINEDRVSQTFGHAWDSGNALLSLGYYKRDLLPASKRDFVPNTSDIGSLSPGDKDYSAVFTGRQNIAESLSLFADALYTKRDTFNEGGETIFNETYTSTIPQVTATIGLDWQVGGGWQVEASGSYAEEKLDIAARSALDDGGGVFSSAHSQIRSAQIKADGPVLRLPGGTVSAAVGAEFRSESFRLRNQYFSGLLGSDQPNSQDVRSAFAEIIAPVVGASNAITGVQRIDLSLAARFDDYSIFGSHFDPKIGVMWQPVDGLRLRSSYGTSYKAPSLNDYSTGGNATVAIAGLPDPGTPSGVSNQLIAAGSEATGLTAQKSRNISVGAEWTPEFAKDFQLRMNYYDINYRDQIARPPAGQILAYPAYFGDLTIRNPTLAQVNQYIAYGLLGQGFSAYNADFSPNTNFDPASINVIVDERLRNLSVTKTNGVDLSLQYDAKVAGSDLHLGLDGTYILKLQEEITSTSPAFDLASTIFNPPHLRLRGSAGWRRSGWSANAFVNYTSSYTDDRVPTALVPVSSYTTVDARVSYDFKARFQNGVLSGLTISLSAQNLFDTDPPRTAVIDSFRDAGYDPTNANPLGRLVALGAVLKW